MKLRYEDIRDKKGNRALLAFTLNLPRFEFNWHYHPEYELTLITKGEGRRQVGDSYENFTAGDLVLIGPGLPHTWVSNPLIKGKKTAVVIQFSKELVDGLLNYHEMGDVKRMLQRSEPGLYFPKLKKQLADKILTLPLKNNADKLGYFILILDELSKYSYRKLASDSFEPVKGEKNENRINKVLKFIQDNSDTLKCNISHAASLIHLSGSAFCKFFKRMTGKTFSDYVNEVRVTNACLLLAHTDKTIITISFETGFETLTYFNRVFKRKKGITPKEFRKRN